MEGETGWRRGEAGRDTSIERVQGKKGREFSNKEGKQGSHRRVCYLALRTGTAEILMGFLNLRVIDFLTDRDRPMKTDSHTLTCTCCTFSRCNRLRVAL